MFDPGSRYYALEKATYTTKEGKEIAYIRRRFCPQADTLSTLIEVTVNDGDRLDQIAAKTIGNPEHFWRICDAQNAMNPEELTQKPGRSLTIPIPEVIR